MTATLPFREALNEGVASGTLADTKIIVFSRRNSSGKVYGPRALYASGHVLKSVPYFNDLLFGDFAEAEPKDFNGVFAYDESTEDYDYYSDSDLEDDEDEKVIRPKTARDVSKTIPCKSHPPGDGDSYHINHTGLANKGKVVRIPDMAFITFQAFIFYLYTGQIEFAPFRSGGNRSSGTTDDELPRPSAKSVYRLADKYDVPTLKGIALGHIRSELKNCDIIEETFCAFTSRYDDVGKACVTQLLSLLRNDTTEKTTWMKVCDVIDAHFKGDLDHVADTLSLLWQTANEVCKTTTTSDNRSSLKRIDSPASCNALQSAMGRSIREGVFFDRKYWVWHSRKGNTLKAVYFSSIIVDNELVACITSSNNQNAPARDPMGEVDAESDCENDSAETGDGIPVSRQDSIKDEGGDRTYVVLSPGSFSAWRSLFFYKCTGRISFAPLMSQGVDSRSMYILANTTTDAPPPCSPKSIYVLATLLNIQPLCDLALKDIESKLSEDNIVEELFSRTIANQQQVVEMECQLLFSKFKNEATITRVQENINGTPGNRLAHRAGAFKLALRAALDLKERSSQAGVIDGVMLQCRNAACLGNKERFLYSIVGSSTYCPRCSSYYMRCTGCEHIRDGIHSCCKSCRKKFA